ncbi:RDD family protein [Zafaria sp. Z1313]|uniref:RDD family protein n=1 Tax=unclassified Zafaria TaxID=2828765 RepID=UPI002E77050E|nr:RDD family protein [Zafaria sp. J156]MEE1620002.1 RDD family protein [Zafaria sp. J156]
MAAALNLVNASAGKRLAAWLLDAVPPFVALMVFGGVNASRIADAAVSPEVLSQLAASYLVLGAFLLAYGIALWGWEAQTGKTLGNLALGLRTSDEDGFAPGWLKVFLRRLIVGLSSIVPVAGPVVVLVSNLWDANHQRQGWHDKVAKTLVVDVNQGRNPITTGGLFGPSTFAPGGATLPGQLGHPDFTSPSGERWPALAPDVEASGPITAVPTPGTAPAPGSGHLATAAPGNATPSRGAAAAQTPAPASYGTVPAAPAPASAAPGSAPTATGSAHPDDEFARTQLRAPAPAGARLVFDDGQVLAVKAAALIGRNPAPQEGESVDELFNFADMGRSVSKTHLHVTADSSGVWVTDRNSTNGSAVTGTDGVRRQLPAGQAQRAAFGDTVHFGDRSFKVERA